MIASSVLMGMRYQRHEYLTPIQEVSNYHQTIRFFERVKEKGPGRTLNVHCTEFFVLQSHVQERAVCGNKVAY